MKTQLTKPKRKRITLPTHTTTVEIRIKALKRELGLTTFDGVWQSIQFSVNNLNY